MSQIAWETAMGLRNYAGSPAEKENREEAKRQKSQLSLRIYPLTHPIVEKELTQSNRVMIRKNDRLSRGTHYRVWRDDAGHYIRQGKRGSIKRYLSECQITRVNGKIILFEFCVAHKLPTDQGALKGGAA